MTTSDAPKQWAVRQLADYDARTPGTLFAEGITFDVAQAYRLQSAVTQLRCDRGEKVIGYKVGCTSPVIRTQLGIDHCVTGRLFDREHHASGAVLPRTNFASLAIEGELAVELSNEPTEDDFSANGIPKCVARVFPVIELHNHVMHGEQPTAGELIANNAIHAGLVAGDGINYNSACAIESPDSITLAIFVDDKLVEEASGSDLIQTIRSSLIWLTQVIRDRGEQLCPGQIILTGSIPSLISISEDSTVRVDAQPIGDVEVHFN